MSQPQKTQLTEGLLEQHQRTYRPNPATHARYASKVVDDEGAHVRNVLLCLQTGSSAYPLCPSLLASIEKDNKGQTKSAIETPLERFLTPGDPSEPSLISKQLMNEHGIRYGARASVGDRKRIGSSNCQSAMSNGKAAKKSGNACTWGSGGSNGECGRLDK